MKNYYSLKECVQQFHSNNTCNEKFYFYRKYTIPYHLYYKYTRCDFDSFFEYNRQSIKIQFIVPHIKNNTRYKIPKLIFDKIMIQKRIYDAQNDFLVYYISELEKILGRLWYKDLSNLIISYVKPHYPSLLEDFSFV
jgi:hypothetical protein